MARIPHYGENFDPHTLRASLRPFDPEALSVSNAAELAYFRFYGLDIESRLPSLVHHFGALELSGRTIACHLYQLAKPRGCCVLVHGYYDHAGLYAHLIEYCLCQGHDVLIWDLPGHGLSSGEVACIDSFEDYVKVFDQLLGRLGDRLSAPLTMIGQSTGGAILMRWVLKLQRADHPDSGMQLVLLAPLIRPRAWRFGRLLFNLLRPFRRSIRRRFGSNSSDQAFVEFVRQDPLQSQRLPLGWVAAMRSWIAEFESAPTSTHAPEIIQGDGDRTVDWIYNLKRIRLKFPSARVTMIAGARHHLVNESPTLRAQIFDAIPLSNHKKP